MPPPHFELWDRKILMSSYGVYGMFVYMVYWKCKFYSKSYAYSLQQKLCLLELPSLMGHQLTYEYIFEVAI